MTDRAFGEKNNYFIISYLWLRTSEIQNVEHFVTIFTNILELGQFEIWYLYCITWVVKYGTGGCLSTVFCSSIANLIFDENFLFLTKAFDF